MSMSSPINLTSIESTHKAVTTEVFQYDYSVVIPISLVLEEDEELMVNNNVSRGEIYPMAVKVTPVSDDFSNFTISEDPEKTYVVIRSSAGNAITTEGKLVIDNTNKTVMFIWDTNNYSIDQYIIIFWVTLEYSDNEILLSSDPINKSLRQESVLD